MWRGINSICEFSEILIVYVLDWSCCSTICLIWLTVRNGEIISFVHFWPVDEIFWFSSYHLRRFYCRAKTTYSTKTNEFIHTYALDCEWNSVFRSAIINNTLFMSLTTHFTYSVFRIPYAVMPWICSFFLSFSCCSFFAVIYRLRIYLLLFTGHAMPLLFLRSSILTVNESNR